MVTQRPAKPCTPVRFRAWPPDFIGLTVFHLGEWGKLCYIGSLERVFLGSSVVEQLAVNQLVAGSNPARGATLIAIIAIALPTILHKAGLHPEYNGPTTKLVGKRALIITTRHNVLNLPLTPKPMKTAPNCVSD